MKDNVEREPSVSNGNVGDSSADSRGASAVLNLQDAVRDFPQSSASAAAKFAHAYKSALAQALESVDLKNVERAIQLLADVRESGHQTFVCGNGGSASTASHFVCDMVKGASFNRVRRFRIMALTDSLPTLTAYSNDVSYESVFVEQLRNFAETGDVLIAISGSGNSPNVLRAVEYANSAGCRTIALTGRDGGKLGSLAQLNIQVSHPHMGRIEDSHMMALHMISYYFMELPEPALR